jgi:hypothetical protein
MLAHQNGGRARLSRWPEGDHEGRTHEVPQEDDVQVCTLSSVYIYCSIKQHLALATYVSLMTNNHFLFTVYKLCLYDNRCLFSAG